MMKCSFLLPFYFYLISVYPKDGKNAICKYEVLLFSLKLACLKNIILALFIMPLL